MQRPKNDPKNGDSGSPRPKRFKTQKSSSKVLVSVFWDEDGILFVDYLEKDATITAKNYVALLNKLKQQLVSKRRAKLSKGICIFKKILLLTRQPLRTTNWHIFTLKLCETSGLLT
jgi:hypothetical protein